MWTGCALAVGGIRLSFGRLILRLLDRATPRESGLDPKPRQDPPLEGEPRDEEPYEIEDLHRPLLRIPQEE